MIFPSFVVKLPKDEVVKFKLFSSSPSQRRVKGGQNVKDENKVTGYPVWVLHELVPDIEYDVKEEKNMDGSNTKTFTLTVNVNEFPYSAQGEF